MKYYGLILILFYSCERNTDPEFLYDLFPLSVGNEFYYSVVNFEKTVGENPDSMLGKKKWVISSKSEDNSNNVYYFDELFYGGVRYDAVAWPEVPNPERDTILLESKLINFEVIESRSGEISFNNFPLIPSDYYFSRYSTVSDTIFRNEDWFNTGSYSYYQHFVKDSGLIGISKYLNSAHHRNVYIYTLDSLLIAK